MSIRTEQGGHLLSCKSGFARTPHEGEVGARIFTLHHCFTVSSFAEIGNLLTQSLGGSRGLPSFENAKEKQDGRKDAAEKETNEEANYKSRKSR